VELVGGARAGSNDGGFLGKMLATGCQVKQTRKFNTLSSALYLTAERSQPAPASHWHWGVDEGHIPPVDVAHLTHLTGLDPQCHLKPLHDNPPDVHYTLLMAAGQQEH